MERLGTLCFVALKNRYMHDALNGSRVGEFVPYLWRYGIDQGKLLPQKYKLCSLDTPSDAPLDATLGDTLEDQLDAPWQDKLASASEDKYGRVGTYSRGRYAWGDLCGEAMGGMDASMIIAALLRVPP